MDILMFGGTKITLFFGMVVISWVLWGLRPGLKAIRHLKMAATTEEAKKELVKAIQSPVDNFDVPITILTAKTLYDGVVSHKQANEPIFFGALEDSTEQIMENFLENRYIRPITLYANVLPPIGFIGTVVGMILVFSAGSDSAVQINTKGLGIALLSTLYALSGFVLIELVKIWIVNRASHCIDVGINLFHELDNIETPEAE
jgi:biopolymer transport protein ExbB/TolQ